MLIRRTLLAAVILVLGMAGLAPISSAASYDLELVRITVGSSSGASSAASLEGVSFVYDDVAGTVTQLSPRTTANFKLGPITELFGHRFRGAVFNLADGTISASAYACLEGGFGMTVGASLCANTTFGANFENESTFNYTTIPGTRSIGGDDVAAGPQQQLSDYASTLTAFDGSTLRIQSAAWTANPSRAGVQLQFEVTVTTQPVDVPQVRGLDQATAEAYILAANLAVGTVSTAHHPSVPAGALISQNPSACLACVAPGSAVNFMVSLGPVTGGTVSDQIMELMDQVAGLELHRNRARALKNKLEKALRRVEREQYVFALFDLYRFSRQVEWAARKRIPAADARELAAGADAIIGRLIKELTPKPGSGLRQFTSQDSARSYYIEIPEDYSPLGTPKPVLFMFHGTGGTYANFFPGGLYAEEGSDLRAKVGNDAIMVFPNALPNANGTNQWDYSYDLEFFRDLLQELGREVVFDEKRIFVTGHSSGGGFSHELGCQLGDVVRAVAPSAGALTSEACTGSVAVMQIQSMNDTVVSPNIAEPTRRFWVLYNGFDNDSFSAGTTNPCIDYSGGDSLYPVQWCFHEDTGRGGHQWWSKAEAIWDFFATLPIVAPTADHPPGGGNDRVNQESGTTLSFTLEYPDTIGSVWRLAAVLYPAGTGQPVFTSPFWFLNVDIDPGAATPGTQRSYTVPVELFNSSPTAPLPGTYALSIAVYVTGGGFPTPIAGIDHIVFRDVEIIDKTTPIVVEEVLTVEPVL